MPNQILSSTYEVREEIGSGGGGVVYKAWHVRLKKEVVLKKLKRGPALSLQTQRAEADILKTLRHSYLPQLYDFLIEGEEVYTVIDFIPGHSLDKLLEKERRYPQLQVIKWALQLCEALVYLHGQKPSILHSDIKPANIMLTSNGDICLIDFNISLLLGDDGAVAVGRSHGYASPEQYGEVYQMKTSAAAGATVLDSDGNATVVDEDANATILDGSNGTQILIQDEAPPKDGTAYLLPSSRRNWSGYGPPGYGSSTSSAKTVLDVRSDVYSLGATLYHLLTGEKPAISTGKVKPLSSFGLNFSEGVTYIIEKAMSQNPSERFQTSGEMLRAIQNIHKLDRRWKMQTLKKDSAAIVLVALFAASSLIAFMGHNQMGREKVERYETAVLGLEHTTDAVEIEQLFDYAASLFPDRLDAFHAKALALFQAGRCVECIDFIENSLVTLHPDPDDPVTMAKLGDIYSIAASCYLERDDYQNSVIFYRTAVDFNHGNAEYYRDYAISLARTGDISAAEEVARTAQGMGLSSDSLSLLRGEIAFAKGQYPEAAEHFRETLQTARDSYILYRAYRICADAFKQQNLFDEEIALMLEAKAILPAERVNEITERLADAYVRGALSGTVDSAAYYQKAADSFRELLDRGFSTFLIRQNLAIVYHHTGSFEQSEQVLLELSEDYPEDYRVPMRLAYLYADMQTRLENEQRDYAQMAQSFDRALELYETLTRSGYSDPEMLMLADMMEQLAQGGWLSR